ncbi:MAG: polymer-forming cytoskeletal protein [Pseudomonadota bacterium]
MSESTDHSTDSGRAAWNATMPGSTGQSGASMIGPTVVIRGEVTAEEDLMVKGRVEGFIDHSQTVTIHAEGTVAAEVKAQEVLVEGTVDGNVYGTKRVQIAETGNVTGNVYAPRVGVLEGASFKGAIDMDSDVDAIERRFREQTGTESKAAPKVEATSTSKSSKATADLKEETNAALSEEKGTDTAADTDGADSDA